MVHQRLLPLLALVCAACASTTVAPTPLPTRSFPPTQSAKDVAEFRAELQDVYAKLVAMESKPASPATVDVEAAASIPIPDHRSIRGAVNLFSTDLKPNVQSYLTRAAKYRKMIDKALSEAGVPNALSYLPLIESGYSSTMTSRAGARGMWQFMSDTAREYGLRVDWWVDERADPERSTRAAAQYIKDLYREFNDWPLTLAAYNAGPGRIRRALADTGASSFWELCDESALPKETRGYVPTFYATLIIASDPATHGFTLAAPENSEIRRIDLEGPLSLKYLAEVANLDEEVVRDLNPAFRHGVLPPGRSSVRLPAAAAELVASRAAGLKKNDADVAVCSFRMREGDSLKRVARAIGTDVQTILAMNDLSSASRVGEGDSLYLPVRARELGALLQQQSITYAVRKGDTLYSIAKKHNLTVAELRDLNDLGRHHKLHAGERLLVSLPRSLITGGM